MIHMKLSIRLAAQQAHSGCKWRDVGAIRSPDPLPALRLSAFSSSISLASLSSPWSSSHFLTVPPHFAAHDGSPTHLPMLGGVSPSLRYYVMSGACDITQFSGYVPLTFFLVRFPRLPQGQAREEVEAPRCFRFLSPLPYSIRSNNAPPLHHSHSLTPFFHHRPSLPTFRLENIIWMFLPLKCPMMMMYSNPKCDLLELFKSTWIPRMKFEQNFVFGMAVEVPAIYYINNFVWYVKGYH